MKRMKKIMAVLLTAIMTMAMAVTAFAANTTTGNGKLTVNVKSGEGVPTQTLTGQTIYLYKLFDVTESTNSESTKNYAYTVNKEDGYKGAIKSALGENSSITDSSTDVDYAKAVLDLGENNSEAVQNFANAFTTYALTNKLAATANSGKITETGKNSYDFSNLAYGYYLVYVTGGKEIQSSLVTVDEGTTTVNLKSEAPSIKKTADKDTVEIGNVVTYTVTGSIPDTTGYAEYQYIIHDILSTGLDFVNDESGTALTKDATEVNVTVAFTDTSVTDAGTIPTTATLATDNHRKISLDLSAWVRDNQTNKGKEFTVTYYAKVNANAVVTEKNSATLEYGNDPTNKTETTPSEAKTPTYPLNIKKTNNKTTKDLLAGAKFSLYTEEEYNKGVENRQAIKVSGSNGNYVVNPASTNTVFESYTDRINNEEYNLRVNGLAAGTYYLVETQAPDGYNKLAEDVKIIITRSTTGDETEWTISKDDKDETDKIIDIENSTGSLLPSTGGRGTIVFAVVATLLVLGVVVSFIRDKRKAAK